MPRSRKSSTGTRQARARSATPASQPRGTRIHTLDDLPRSRAETWVQARAAPGPERASPLRRGSPGLDSRSSRDESANKRRNHAGMVPADRRLVKFGARG